MKDLAQSKLQSVLDEVLLPKGILSHHLRRDTTPIADKRIRQDTYVVYRKISHNGDLYGDGREIQALASYDVSYYYKYKSAKDDRNAYKLIRHLITSFREKGWRILSGAVDIYDMDNDFNGLVFEVALTGKQI